MSTGNEDGLPMAAVPRVTLRGCKEENWNFVFVQPRRIADAVGHRLLAAFLKCFVGVDRLLSLEQLMVMNSRAQTEDSVAYTRNLRLIVQLLAATAYETGIALQEISNAKVVGKMRDASKWEPLNRRRGKWRGDARLAKFRNQLGHHLGDSEIYDAGLERMLTESGDEVVLEHGCGRFRHGGEHVLAQDTLWRGLSIDEADFREIVEITYAAHSELPCELVDAFTELLTSCGVEVVDESEPG